MDDETPLEALLRRVRVEEAGDRIAAAGEAGAAILPAVNGILAFPGAPHLLHPTSALCGLAPFQFSRLFKQVMGMGFHEFADRVRVDGALRRLADRDRTTQEIAQELGFLGSATLALSIEEYTGLPLLAVLALLRPSEEG